MTSVVALQASAHKFITEKFTGNEKGEFAGHINAVLNAAAVQLDYSNPSTRADAFKAYLELVDFRTLTVDAINSLLVDKWSNTNETWRIWVNNYGLSDFKLSTVTALGAVRKPRLIQPKAEYQTSELIGELVNAKLETFGDLIKVDRYTIVNDDNSAIQTLVNAIAAAYDRLIGDLVYDYLRLNPVTFNTTELFHADHANIVTATSDFEADLASAMGVMYAQKMDINDDGSEVLHIQPKYVIVPPSKAFTAARIVGQYNIAVTDVQKLTVIVESRLTGFSGWFLACDNPYSSIALFTLNDLMAPEVFTKANAVFNTDGLEVKHRFDFDVRPIDYRGLVRVS
jgi:hypothetical protein